MTKTCDVVNLQKIKFYNRQQARLLDREYLDEMTEVLGTQMSRVMWALYASGHADIDSFSDDEWQTYANGYGKLIGVMLAQEQSDGISH